jgi:hypothetical protein
MIKTLRVDDMLTIIATVSRSLVARFTKQDL